ncbi:DHHW family protein [Romboutsia lituseburensis]|uniref:DHHW family protein n=1 Tax=Romboutsia lituseburensis TaxID=1537 RepID=UPI00215AF002|nr:DHHW family protein [Romboutsia lituseburensis]MCR8744788.1 DHHW family protein [Romboutsia lituseburensis]
MNFTNISFIFIFLPITLILYYIFPKRFKNLILLISSLLFYSFGKPIYILLMLFTTVFNYYMGIFIDKNKENKSIRKKIFIFTIIVDISILLLFKCYSFLVHDICSLLLFDITSINTRIPLGISFYTLLSISYIIDIYRGNVKIQKNFISIALYISLLPILIFGPIVKYKDIEYQLFNRNESINKLGKGIELFLMGLAKKVLIADNIGILWKNIIHIDISNLSVVTSWVGIAAVSLHIYFNISAYSDMAIGIGKMFGFEITPNFNYPYMSKSVCEFFRRWFVSLGSWFKDYIYIPLGGNKVSSKKQSLNILLVWLIVGIWAGCSLNYLFFAIYFATIILLEKTVLKNKLKTFPKFICHLYTLIIVSIGWMLFSMNDLSSCFSYIKVMLFMSGNPIFNNSSLYYTYTNFILLIISIILCTPFISKKFYKLKLSGYGFPTFINIVIFLISLSYLVSSIPVDSNFIGKELFIKVKSSIDLIALNKDNNDVFLGKDGYLIENFVPNNNYEINKTSEAINKFSIKNKNLNTYLAIIPNSVSILESKLPKYAPVKNQKSYIDEFAKKLNKNTKYINTFDALKKVSDKYIYYKTDKHWTSLGAYTTFLKLQEDMLLSSDTYYDVKKVSNNFTGNLCSQSGFRSNNSDDINIYLPSNTNTDFIVNYLDNKSKKTTLYNTTKLDSQDKYSVFLNGDHPIIEINTTTNTPRQLLLIKDSYANSMVPYLLESYSKITIVDPKYYSNNLYDLIDDNKFTDVLFLYNANTFFKDTHLVDLLNLK